MYNIVKIIEPRSFSEALTALSNTPDLTVIAGGTDVLVKLKKTQETLSVLSLDSVDEMRSIRKTSDGSLAIGALTTFDMLMNDPLINEHTPILKQAAGTMGGPQIRNRATVGGNLCNGAVSADSAPALLTLNAKLVISRLDEGEYLERIVPLESFYKGPGKVDLAYGELLKDIIIPKDSFRCRGGYIKYSRRKAMDLAMLGVSVLGIVNESNGVVEDFRIALGVAAPTPIRLHEAESVCIGKKLDQDLIKAVCDQVVQGSHARDSWRASKAFREYLMRELTSILMNSLIKEGSLHD